MRQSPVLYRAGTIISQDGTRPEAFAVAGDRISASGSFRELSDRHPDAEVVDLGDAVVVPGFNDAHAHLADTVQSRLDLDVSPASVVGVEGLLDAVRNRTATRRGWVLAGNYDDSVTGRIDRAMLDAAAPTTPVIVRHVSAHWAVLNSRALEELGVGEDAPDIAGGSYGRDPHGRLDGRVYERALLGRYVSRPGDALAPLPAPEPADVIAEYARVTAEWNAVGITSTCDAFVGPQQLEIHSMAKAQGGRGIRVAMLLAAERYEEYRALGLGTDFGDEWLRVAGVKAFVDGAIGGRTCRVSEPFVGTHDHGMLITTQEELDALVGRVHADGNRLAIHANGDVAIRMLLQAYETAAATVQTGVRHRIEHCSIVDAEIITRIAALGLTVVPFSAYARFYGGRLEQWYGADRVERLFAHRAFLDAGVAVAASTDHPASPIPPLGAIQSMVTRRGVDGMRVGETQAISVEEAIGVYTIGSATATGEEGRKGRLAPGYLADFVALGADPRRADPEGISEIPVRATFTGGKLVHGGA
ncbi:putative amidohydrolase YtcJ [Agromyces cerinus]|uniref:amidohydrolase n=1 Tax=Agromyces cerinus TaxID=33878 RepID=UPI00195F20B4|nr:amidohydrolase [Agromyces cerinus]MBM7831703.1 putative amidohydrolase YtcJ [Agromyces cerinus]